jgi:hypothetical protein
VARVVAIADDAIVIRFRPSAADRALASAEKENVRVGHAGLSVFASQPLEGETEDETHSRLLGAAQLDRVVLAKNPKFYVCARASEITALGFRFLKDDEPNELPEHYCIDLGLDPTVDTVQRLLSRFAPHETGGVAL